MVWQTSLNLIALAPMRLENRIKQIADADMKAAQ
jgi:hypothetical protein